MRKSGSEGRGEQTTARERGTGGSPLTLRSLTRWRQAPSITPVAIGQPSLSAVG